MKRYSKFIVALIDAIAILIADLGLEAHPAWVSALAVLGALGVYAVPNKPADPKYLLGPARGAEPTYSTHE